jgi:nucleoside diphosphate kinase
MREKINFIRNDDSYQAEGTQQLINRLQGESIHEKIHSNHMTLAMIRPSTEFSVNFTNKHAAAEDILEEHIESLGIHTKLSLALDEEAVTDFYADTISRQMDKPPELNFIMQSRWHEFQQLMTSGPSVVMLLESHDQNAVDTWRAQLGHWNIEASRDPSTLRGKFGVHNHNNLFHGSDSPEAALHELHIIIGCLKRAQNRN